MDERRKSRRIGLQSRLVLKRLSDRQIDEEATIEVIDASKTGVGFICSKRLEMGNVYEAYLTIWTKEVLHAFFEIVRMSAEEDHYVYGATFVGMSELDASKIETYSTVNAMQE